jgi:hypothetical protein
MQPYFDPTRKTTSKKKWKNTSKKIKMEDDLQKNKNGRRPQKINENGGQPQIYLF